MRHSARQVLRAAHEAPAPESQVARCSRRRCHDETYVLKRRRVDSVEARIVGVDRKNRGISLSIKAKDQADTRRNMGRLREQESESSPTTIGDLIKQQMGQD